MAAVNVEFSNTHSFPSQSRPTALSTSSPTMASSPWGNVPRAAPVSFGDVMSEDLAKELTDNETKQFKGKEEIQKDLVVTQEPQGAEAAAAEPTIPALLALGEMHPQDTSNDEVLAQLLQAEMDREHDMQLKREEAVLNKQSKVSLSFTNYMRSAPKQKSEEDEDDDDEEEEDEEEEEQRPAQRVFRNGVSGKGSNMISKHDVETCNRKNASKSYSQFPLGLNLGDDSGMDMKINNKVFNKLKGFSQQHAKKTHRVQDKKEVATATLAMDEKTSVLLYKLENAEILKNVTGIISTGKEASILHAYGGSATNVHGFDVPKEIALKVFKTTLTDFKNRAEYVKGDVRFFKDEFKKQNTRKIMRIWAQKEEFNLRKLAKHINVPRVVDLRKHILVMSFIGKDREAAPKLRDARLSLAECEIAWDQVKDTVKKMYQDCMLVHGDLSEYNLLWWEDAIVVIDVGQAVDVTHPHAHEFLLRDCRNMTRFFNKAGVANVGDEYELFNYVTGQNLKGSGDDFLMGVREAVEKSADRLMTEKSSKHFAFDHFFEMAQKQRKDESESEEEEDEEEEEEEQQKEEGEDEQKKEEDKQQGEEGEQQKKEEDKQQGEEGEEQKEGDKQQKEVKKDEDQKLQLAEELGFEVV